jgi:hypothetical protein
MKTRPLYENLNKEDKILWDIYRELYLNSEPSVDFDELVENAKTNDNGEFIIDFDSYVIDEKSMENIIEARLKKNKIIGYKKKLFRTSVYLGCSPRTKTKVINN